MQFGTAANIVPGTFLQGVGVGFAAEAEYNTCINSISVPRFFFVLTAHKTEKDSGKQALLIKSAEIFTTVGATGDVILPS